MPFSLVRRLTASGRSPSLLSTLAAALFTSCASATFYAVSDDANAQSNPSPQAEANASVVMKTSLGDIVIELNAQKAPQTVANFLKYVDDGFYSGTIFHRVIGTFMIQGGGMDKDLNPKQTREAIALESQNGLTNDTGTIAMARTSAPNSATSQFFINLADNDSLNYPSPDGHGYAVFGKVVEGMDVVNKIAAVRTGRRGPHGDVPEEAITITSVARVAAK